MKFLSFSMYDADKGFDEFLSMEVAETADVCRMLADQSETTVGVGGFEPPTT